MHVRLFDISERSARDATKARAGLEGTKIRLGEVEQETNMADFTLDEAQEQSMNSGKAVEEASRQPTKMLRRAQLP